jgi:uncharacterized membrane protein
MFYMPIALLFFLLFWGLFILLIALIQIGILQYAFETMGVSRRYMFGLLMGSLLGSYVNIPIAHLQGQAVRMGEVVDFYGMRYVVPIVVDSPGTVLAVNLGGAVIPFLLSLYLMKRHRLFAMSILAIAIVTVVVHWMAQPVRGVGIAVPIFIPPVITAIVALTLWPRNPAPLAYIAGSMGTLVGADLLNLNKIQNLGAPVASIGGAGKFDGIFLTGILAVLLAGIFGRRRRPA